ncbi:MAG TPA: M14 family metallopeptidase [Thermomicrobiales bacterium]|nr:M14 family metallopeptidase [Thermomicrobiales bacterium]
MGSDHRLVRWVPMCAYFRLLAARSDRVRYEEYALGWGEQPLVLLTISSPEILARLDEFRAIQDRLFDPRCHTPAERASLVAEGRCVCLITCSIHATEVGPTQFAPELVYELVTRDDEAVHRILREVIVLVVPSLNPGGLELVADWYERTLDTPYAGTAPPALYHPYAGHDNNRDWFMLTQVENRATVAHVLNRWHPQIVFDLHQMQVNGPRFVLPPYIDPYDPNVDPILTTQIDALGSTIAAELTARNKRGVATSVIFDAFSPSRSYPNYHGGVRMLAEAASVRIASPVEVAREFLGEARGFDPRTASHNHPLPWEGGNWRLRDILDYFGIATFALLDHAARYRDRWVANFATVQGSAVANANPFAYLVLPLSYQRDPGTTAEMIEVLLRGGVEVEQATSSFTAEGVEMPVGTFVVRIGQPAGRYAKTLLEVQHYPSVPLFPGGPLKPPYDITSHTLPLQMGVDTVRVESPFLFQANRVVETPCVRGRLVHGEGARHFLVGPEANGSARLINRLFDEGASVARCEQGFTVHGRRFPSGAFLIEDVSTSTLDRFVHECGVDVFHVPSDVDCPRRKLQAPRIGVYRSWRPNAIDEGWTRFVLERFEFPYQTVRDADVKRGDLSERFDAIVLPQQSARDILEGNSLAEYPAEFAGGIGDVGASNLRRFVEAGGTLIALDAACDLAIRQLYLPVTNVLDGVRAETFSAPGSLLRILIDADHPIGWGFERESAAMFVSSPAFEVRGGAQTVAQYPLTNQLLSGWLHGADQIAGRAAIVDVAVGFGRAILIGFRPQFRAQARGTYRILFNSLFYSVLEPAAGSVHDRR